ncbi:MAG: SpoIIE family protein phosphatase [Pirellulaceae bacterium]
MTTKTTSHLRVHHRDASSAVSKAKIECPKSSVDNFWHAYHEVTGWRIDSGSSKPSAGTPSAKSRVRLRSDADAKKSSKLSAQRLADSASRIADQLADAHETIRIQAAELAARAAIFDEPQQVQLADALSETLADVVAAARFDAAAIYLLDEETQYLSVRGIHGLPASRLTDGPRELRGSRGDLEAMVQGSVMISDLQELSIDTWSCPENASSAICVAIHNAGVPIGTLWMYCNEQQMLDESHGAIARMAAKQVALQLQHAATPADAPAKQDKSSINELAQWQFASLPLGAQLAPNWRVDGMIESPQPWATGWHAWDVLPDGSLMIAIAEAEDKSVAGSMTAAIARAALESHTGYRHTPRQLLQRISDTLWQTNTMDQLTSLMYVRIDPETGEGEIATSGNMIAMIASSYGYRPAVESNGAPLASQIDLNCGTSTFRMSCGEVLMAYSEGFANDEISQMTIGNQLRQTMQSKDDYPLASIRRYLANKPMNHERGAVTILRQ